MNVKIKETGKMETLSIIDRTTGVNWVQDLIGNTGALGDGKFAWSEEDDAYIVEQHTYDWWAKYIADSEATEAEIEALADELDVAVSVIRERIEDGMYGINDYDDHRRVAAQAMNELRREYAAPGDSQRRQFAEVVAHAYINQFSTDGSPVMNQCIITWDGERFGAQSSLTPVGDDEIVAMHLEHGMFGDVDEDDPEAATWIKGYLMDSASDEGWRDVIAAIDQAMSDKAAIRVGDDADLSPHHDILIAYEWDNQRDHLAWVATADKAEIISWIASVRQAE